MSETTVTVSEPLKEHLKSVRRERKLSSLDATIRSVLSDPVGEKSQVEEGNIDHNPAPIKIDTDTLEFLKDKHRQNENNAYEDTLRSYAGATSRRTGEEPVEWKPLDS